ncbi:putative ribonuclease H-like domain-containing protein [Tanacetum coccineum]
MPSAATHALNTSSSNEITAANEDFRLSPTNKEQGPLINEAAAEKEEMDLETAQTTTTAKLPILKQENGNSFKPAAQTTTNVDGNSTTLIPGLITTEEKVQKKNDMKARSMLLMALPNEHLMTFNQYKDAKTLFAAIQTRFGGNEATKKTQKTLLKQICLPSEWNTHIMVWRNKPDLDTMSFDDLYNNFKIVEQEVKGTASSSSSSSSQNMAFVSSPSSTNEVNTAYEVSTANTQVSPASTQVSTASTQVSTANLSDATVYAFLANQPNGSQLVHKDLENIHEDNLEEMDLKWQLALLTGYDKSKVECFNCHKMGHFTRECRGPRNQDSRNKNQGGEKNQKGSRRTINVEETSSKAMVAIDGAGFDWSYMVDDEVPRNMDLMAFSESEPDLSNSGLEEFQQLEFEGYGPKTSKSVNEDIYNKVRESPDALLVEELVLDDKLEKKTIFLTVAMIEFVRPKQQEKPVMKPFKYAKMYSFNHVQADCNYNQRERVVSENNYTRVNYNYSAKKAHPSAHKNIVPRAVLMKTSLKPLSTARHVSSQKEIKCYVDSGCSRHMTRNMSYLSDFKEFDGGYVTFWGVAKGGKITGKGTLKTSKLDFEDVLLKVPRKNNMYSIDMKNIIPKECLTCLVTKATLDESMLWHKRLGHVNFKTINNLVKENLVRGLPSKRFENNQTCIACLKGKQHKASCKSKIRNFITQPLFMLHMDLFGLTFVSSLMNKKYCLVVTDDYSRFTWVFFLATKDETSGILKSFITEIENLVDKKVKIIRCDNGTEFKNRVMSEFCEKKGIKKEFSIARTPQQNGVAERRNRTLIEAARTMVLVVKPHNKTPYELFRGRTPALSFMRPFGCHVTILNTLDYLGKFDGKSDEGFFVGYSMNSKAFRVYNIRTRKVEENLHIRFLEDKPIIAGDGPKWLFDIDVLTKSMNYVPVVAGTNSNDFVDGSLFNSSLKNASNDEPQPFSDAEKKDDKGVNKESGIDDQERPKNSTQDVNTAGPSINTASTNVNTGSLNINTVSPTVTIAPLEATHADLFGDETEINMRNITTTYLVPFTLNTRIHKGHLLDHVIGNVQSGGPVVQGEGSTHPVESHHTPTSAPSTSQPLISPTSRRTNRQESVVPQPRSPTQTPVADEAASTGVDVRYGGCYHTVTGLEGTGQSYDTLKNCGFMYKNCLEGGELETNLTLDKLTYGVAYTKLIKKVKKLENKVKSSQARRRARIIIFNDEDDLEDPSKQGRKIDEIDQDSAISLVQHDAEIAREAFYELDLNVDFDLGKLTAKDVSTAEKDVSTAKPVSTASAAVTTSSVVVSTDKDKGKAKMDESESETAQTKTKLQQEQERLGYEVAVRLKTELKEEEKQRIARITSKGKMKLYTETIQQNACRAYQSEKKQLRGYSFDEIKNLFETTMRRVHTFVLIKSEIEKVIPKLAAGSSRRDAEEELDQESCKRQKTGESSKPAKEPKDKEEELSQEELQQMMIIVPEQGVNVESLQTKYPIIDWEIYTEGTRKYWKIIRVGNHTERTVSKVPDTEDTIKFMLDTEEFTYIVDMFRVTLHLPVETPENPFVAPVNIQTIEAFMNRVSYQGVVDKKFPNIPQSIDVGLSYINDDIPLGKKMMMMTWGNRLEPGSHKENPKHVDDDDEKEKVDENKDDEIGIDGYCALRRMCRRQGYMIQNMERKCVTTKYFWKTHKKVDRVLNEIVPQLAERATDDLIENNLKPSIAATIIEDCDAFRSEVPDLVSQEFNAQAPKIIE